MRADARRRIRGSPFRDSAVVGGTGEGVSNPPPSLKESEKGRERDREREREREKERKRERVQYYTAEWEPAFLRQAREFPFFPLLPREASK